MTGFEFMNEENHASQYELGNVFAKTVIWLEKNTNLFMEKTDEITGTYDGLPVAQGNPRFDFEIPGKLLREVVPASAEFFNEDDTLCLMYNPPHYTTVSGDGNRMQFYQEECVFNIDAQNEPKYEVSLIVTDDDEEDQWCVLRYFDSTHEVHDALEENANTLPFLNQNLFDETSSVKTYMSRREFDVLWAIVDKLGEIKALMPELPLYIPNE